MDAQPGRSGQDVLAQCQRGNAVIPGVLPPEGDRVVGEEPVQPVAQRVAGACEACLVDPSRAVDHMGRQHLEPWIEQYAVLDREQQVIDRPVDAARAVVGFPPSGRHHQHRALAGQGSLAITVPPVGVRVLSDAISETAGVHTIHPALEQCRHAEPPERELQDQGIGPEQLVLLPRDVAALRAALESAQGMLRCKEALAGRRGAIVVRIEASLPAHGIQIGYLDIMACLLQALEREILERAVQGARFRVGMYEENVHGATIGPAKVYWK